MKYFLMIISVAVVISCSDKSAPATESKPANDLVKSKQDIANMLDSFNIAAANAEYEKYFDFFADSAVFIGTDANENWKKPAFMLWAKPFFDKKQTWNFKAIQRSIYFSSTNDIAWFDELLSTHMKICRGSGVVTKQGDTWKIQQYVLSMTIPNSKIKEVVTLKGPIEDSVMNTLK